MMCHGGPNQWSSWANLYTGFKFTGLGISAVTLFFFFGQNNSLDGNGEEKLLELLKDYWNISMSQRSDKQTKLLNI